MGKGSGNTCSRAVPVMSAASNFSSGQFEKTLEENKIFFQEGYYNVKGLQTIHNIIPVSIQEKLAEAISSPNCPQHLKEIGQQQMLDNYQPWIDNLLEARQLLNRPEDNKKLTQIAHKSIIQQLENYNAFDTDSISTKIKKEVIHSLKDTLKKAKWDRKKIIAVNRELSNIELRYSRKTPTKEIDNGEKLYSQIVAQSKELPYDVQDRLVGFYQDTTIPPEIRQRGKDILIRHNQKFIIGESKAYLGRGMGKDELVQEGNKGMIEAIDQYKIGNGNNFITYAKHKVKMRMQRATEDQSANKHGVRIPSPKYNFIHNKVSNAHKKLSAELERDPTIDEVHELVMKNLNAEDQKKTTREDTEEAIQWLVNRSPVSMQSTTSSEDNSATEFGNLIPDGKDTDDEVGHNETRAVLKKAFEQLEKKEREVFASYVGFGDYEKISGIAKVSAAFGIKPDETKKLIDSAREKVQEYIKKHGE